VTTATLPSIMPAIVVPPDDKAVLPGGSVVARARGRAGVFAAGQAPLNSEDAEEDEDAEFI
jgi:hypothetical protein